MTVQEGYRKKLFNWKIVAFVTLHTLIALHLVLWYGFDRTVIGSINMQELFRQFIQKSVINAGVVFFLVFLLLGLFWGRFFCGWLCHIGQAYDLLAELFRKWKIKMRPFRLRFGWLAALSILGWYFIRPSVSNRISKPPEGITVDWSSTAPWELLPGWVLGTTTLVLVLLILPLILGKRAFCKTLCPWGILLGLTNPLGAWKIRKVGNCTQCGACSHSCPMDLDVSRMINTKFHVNHPGCTQCLECVASCSVSALGWSKRGAEERVSGLEKVIPILEKVPLPMELAFWAAVLVVGLSYSEIYGMGHLTAYSLGLVVAWLTQTGIRAVSGLSRMRRTALILALLLMWSVVAKDGLAAYHYRRAEKAFVHNEYRVSQYHFEASDRLFWVSPTVLFMKLYIIYKNTGQTARQEWIRDRYEARRLAEKKSKQ